MFTDNRGYSNQQLIRLAPSVGATQAHESRSGLYGYVPTIDVVQGLRDVGFVPTSVGQARTRDLTRRGYTKHLITFTQERDLPVYQRRVLQELFLQILLINSHGGESSFVLERGVYRLVCDNGLVVGDVEQSIRLQHRGTVVEQVVEAVLAIARDSDTILARIQAMKQVQLSRDEQLAFGRAALALRFPQEVAALPTPAQIIEPERREDQGQDVFSTLNVVQSHLVNGGVPTKRVGGKRHATRAVKDITGRTALNKGLWILAEEMKKLKS